MHSRHVAHAAACLALALLAGCASTQKLSVQTVPEGAQIYLQRKGNVEVSANVAGFHGSVRPGSFKEEFFSLGTSPADYEFQLEEREAAVQGGGAGGSITRRYTEGLIRIVLEGYRTVERLVRFSGSRIDLEVTMQPANEE